MKKTKSLVITSLLFSAMVLNPSTIQGLVVQAADGTANQKVVNNEDVKVTLKFVDAKGKVIETGSPITTYVQGTETAISKSIIKGLIDDSKNTKLTGYKLAEDKSIYSITGEKGNKVVEIELIEKETNKSIMINYINDDKNDTTELKNDTTVSVSNDSKEVMISNVQPPAGYKLSSNNGKSYTIKKDGSIDVHVVPKIDGTRTITVKYQIENSNNGEKINNYEIKDVLTEQRYMLIDQIEIPEGYELSDKLTKNLTIANGIVVVTVKPKDSSTPAKPGLTTKPTVTDKKTYKTTINFVDQTTKKKVQTSNISGKNGQVMSLIVPEGYELAKGVSKNIKIDNNKSIIEVKVAKLTAAKITAFKGLISTKNPSALYSKDGKRVANRGLAINSDWVTDKKMVLNGETYYGVSTNEFVKASNVFEFEAGNTTIKTSNGISKHLFNSNGEMVSNRALAPNTYWRTDKRTMIDGKTAYRVSTNEWVFANDLG
ncbi:SLAP domain-containing protein [Companilactobacillus keshanensis]|uniref:SLAP domain-containing protein n=1 Tax=Companilactobacillus keshanensis TaxID=2486003 RepID=A0ABW4BU08_9LACO|nr:SLAP domain-containing protein [Companilactobacillus keshanensis]